MDHNIIFRGFKVSDGPELEEILKLNGQFDYPDMKNKKIGSLLVDEFRKESKRRGATSLGVTVTD